MLRYVGEWWAAMSREPPVGSLAPPHLVKAYEAAMTLCDAARAWQDIRHSPVALAFYAARAVRWVCVDVVVVAVSGCGGMRV